MDNIQNPILPGFHPDPCKINFPAGMCGNKNGFQTGSISAICWATHLL